jgi:hypothetical protein
LNHFLVRYCVRVIGGRKNLMVLATGGLPLSPLRHPETTPAFFCCPVQQGGERWQGCCTKTPGSYSDICMIFEAPLGAWRHPDGKLRNYPSVPEPGQRMRAPPPLEIRLPVRNGQNGEVEVLVAHEQTKLAHYHFSSTLADNRRTLLMIEPLSQSDRANSNSCLSD